jgi:hypothetical protein
MIITVLGSAVNSCQSPDPGQIIMILALVASIIGFTVFSGGLIIYPLTVLLIEMVTTGASVEAISGAVVAQFGSSVGSVQVVSNLVDAIRSVLSC